MGLSAITPSRTFLLQPDPTTHTTPSKPLLFYFIEILPKLLSLARTASSLCLWSKSLCSSRFSSFSVKSSLTMFNVSLHILGSPQRSAEPRNQAMHPQISSHPSECMHFRVQGAPLDLPASTLKYGVSRDFPGGPVVKILCLQCRESGLESGS